MYPCLKLRWPKRKNSMIAQVPDVNPLNESSTALSRKIVKMRVSFSSSCYSAVPSYLFRGGLWGCSISCLIQDQSNLVPRDDRQGLSKGNHWARGWDQRVYSSQRVDFVYKQRIIIDLIESVQNTKKDLKLHWTNPKKVRNETYFSSK